MAPTPQSIATDPNVTTSSNSASVPTPGDIWDQQSNSGATSHVGVGIGIAILVLALCMTITAAFYILVIKRRKQARSAQRSQETSHHPKESPPPYSAQNATTVPISASAATSVDDMVKEPSRTYDSSRMS